jgi:diacylglycerol kinase family enzyme
MAVLPYRDDPRSGAGRIRARVRVIVNGNASGAAHPAHPDHLIALLRRAGADVQLERTTTLDELAAVWGDDDGRRLVLVGGDGTIHAGVNLGGSARDVALIPAGRANNIARSLGIPLDWEHAARLAVREDVRPVDLIEARAPNVRQLVVEGVSVGFLAQARVRYHGRNSADVPAAVRAGAAALARFHPLTARVTRSAGTEALQLAQLFVANLPLYEFGLRVAPQADPTDATLDLVGIEAPSRRAVLRMLVDLRRGTHLDHPNVHVWRTDRAVVTTNGCSPIVADSTDLGHGPVEFRAVPRGLRLVRP